MRLAPNAEKQPCAEALGLVAHQRLDIEVGRVFHSDDGVDRDPQCIRAALQFKKRKSFLVA